MEKQKKPALRFKGFQDDWEQRKLENYLETSIDKNFEGRYSKADVLSVSGDVGVVNQIEFQGRSFAGASVLNYGVVNTGDIVYTKSPLKSNPYGIIKTNTGRPGIVSTLYAVYHPKQNTDSKFIECYFDSDYRLNKYLHPLVNKGAKNDMKVTADNALKGIVVIPATKGEQTQIAMLISKIEELLTLHQRKLQQLQNLKKAMLEKMFPKNGAKVPEIRFTGFTDDWEQRKLGDLAEFNPHETIPNEFEYVDLESVVGTEMVFHRHELKNTAPSRAQRVAHPGDLFYQTVRPYQRNNYLFEKHDKAYVFSTGYAQMRPFVDGSFLLGLVQSDRFVKNVLDKCTGTSYPAINSNDLSEIKVFCPKKEIEQQKIGNFLLSIDNFITLHQRKLGKLQNLKKAMLEKMFV